VSGIRSALIGLVFLLLPRLALACPVCFGQSDAPLAKAISLGVIAMLVVVAGVLSAFAAFMIYLNRRAKIAAAMEEGTA
jgi:hypothetical protein